MVIRLTKEEFIKMEMLLFGLEFPCHCRIQIQIIDTNEVYDYETININGIYYLQTYVGD